MVKKAFVTDDGKVFDNHEEAQRYEARPKVMEALSKIQGGNQTVSEWLFTNADVVNRAFMVDTVRRVTKKERDKLAEGLAAVAELDDKRMSFLIENKNEILESFKWPKVKKVKEEERLLQARNTLSLAQGSSDGLVDWIMRNEKAIIAAFEAGKERRPVSPQATNALNAYKAAMAAQKQALTEGKTMEEAIAIGKEVKAQMLSQSAAAGKAA